MGKLSNLLTDTPGYFREGEEDNFPWSITSRAVWYSLLTVEEGQIQRYGFTSSKSSKATLCSALQQLDQADEPMLLGIWTGEYSTHLFVLDIQKAICKLVAIA